MAGLGDTRRLLDPDPPGGDGLANGRCRLLAVDRKRAGIARRRFADRRGLRPVAARACSLGCDRICRSPAADHLRVSPGSGKPSMKQSRRDLLKYAALATPLGAAGCASRRPEAKLLPSLAPLPAPFEAPLRRLPSARPIQSDPGLDAYDFIVRAADVRILPGLTTPIWGYDGIFPGP